MEAFPLKELKPLLTLESVTLRVGSRWILPETSWRIHEGEHWVIWGGNGEGKTTLANALAGNGAVVQGRIHHHLRAGGTSGIRPGVALVSPEQYHRLHVREAFLEEMRSFSGDLHPLTFGRDVLMHGFRRDTRNSDPRIDVSVVPGLESLLDKPVATFSSGEMQQLLLARALIQDPWLLILDEPFNGLDSDACRALRGSFDRLTEKGTHLILITHRLEEISGHFSHVLWLEGGRAKWQGTQSAFLRRFSEEQKLKSVSSASRTALPETVSGTGDDFIPEKNALIEMRDVSVRYGGLRILHGLTWTVRAGEHWAVLGPNGAGKTTLLKLITGDNPQAYANTIFLFGKRRGTGESLWDIKRHIGFISDAFHAGYPTALTGFDVVCSGFFDSIGLYRHCTPAQIRIARNWIRILALEDIVEAPFSSLSFGRQRLLLIARAMVKSPRLLILDEACNGLDVWHRQRTWDVIDRIRARGRTTLICTSHHPEALPAGLTHCLELGPGNRSKQYPWPGRPDFEPTSGG